LSELLSKPVGVLQACREGQDPIPDPLHVFVILDDDLVLDVKGQRSRHSMENDFTGLMGLLKAHENDVLSMHHSKLSYASDLYEDLQFDPSHIRRASLDLANHLWEELDFDGKSAIDPSSIARMFSKVTFGSDVSNGW
jgi:hypothetical protein